MDNTQEKKLALAIDFDGVIHAYSKGWHNGKCYDEPVPGTFDALMALRQMYHIYIHTTRNILDVRDWMNWHFPDLATVLIEERQKEPFFQPRGNEIGISNLKLAAAVYIDDRAFMFTGWDSVLENFIGSDFRRKKLDVGLKAYLDTQIEWSNETFGPGSREEGICKHIEKELQEIRDTDDGHPDKLEEWIDVITLGFDGAWRSGATPEQIIECLFNKQAKNMDRKWGPPADQDQPNEHVRDGEELPDGQSGVYVTNGEESQETMEGPDAEGPDREGPAPKSP